MEHRWSLGGVAGNEILTSSVAAVLTVLLMIECVTILQLGPLGTAMGSGLVLALALLPTIDAWQDAVIGG